MKTTRTRQDTTPKGKPAEHPTHPHFKTELVDDNNKVTSMRRAALAAVAYCTTFSPPPKPNQIPKPNTRKQTQIQATLPSKHKTSSRIETRPSSSAVLSQHTCTRLEPYNTNISTKGMPSMKNARDGKDWAVGGGSQFGYMGSQGIISIRCIRRIENDDCSPKNGKRQGRVCFDWGMRI